MKQTGVSIICLCLLAASLATSLARAGEVTVGPAGIYKTINVRLVNDTLKALRDTKGVARIEVIDSIAKSPEDFAPPVLYVLSSVLFEQDKKDEAVFWFYAGQLRGRIDATICADKSARAAVAEMNERFGPPINQYSFTNLALLTSTVERVLAWEEKTPCHYDRRWINLHGMAAMTGDTNAPLSAPKEQWEAIRNKRAMTTVRSFIRLSPTSRRPTIDLVKP